MKKLSLLLMLTLIILLAGCSGGKSSPGDILDNDKAQDSSDSTSEVNAEAPDVDDTEDEGYVFAYKGIDIPLDSEADEILATLGDAMDFFEAESCAFQGMEKVYTYSGFEIHTYEKNGQDYIFAIMFIDDSVATKEGIHLYSSLDDVLETYGDEYTKDMNQYQYESGDVLLTFLIEEDEVESIEYMLKTE